jgi:hypothetical protein
MGERARGVEHDKAEAVKHLVGMERGRNNIWGNAPPLGNGGMAMASTAAERSNARAYAREEKEWGTRRPCQVLHNGVGRRARYVKARRALRSRMEDTSGTRGSR